ncbi:hypothetical protein MMPV_005382 [Pyropia vietnamensis]
MSINRYDFKEALLLTRGERDAELLRLTTLRELPKSLFFSKPAASALPATHRGGWKGRPVVYSHGEVYKMVESVAATMRESGVRPATVCALVAPSGSLEAAVFFLALVWIGAVAAPVDAGLDSERLAVALQACAATIVVSPLPDEGADGDLEEGDGGEALEIGARVANVAKKLGLVSWHLFRTTNEGVKLEMHGARAGVSAAWKGGSADYKVDPEEVAVHLLAYPPTLDPAGGDRDSAHMVDVVRLTHRNLVTSARMFATSYKLMVEQTTLLTCALHDAHGLVVLLATLLSGGQLVLPPAMAAPKEFFSADMFWPLVSSFELDWLSASPANLRILSAGKFFPDKSSIAFVRVATGLHTSSGGSASADDALSVEEVGFLADRVFRAPVLPAYGPAAAAGHAAANTLGASGESPGTLGKPIPFGVRIAILDPVTRAYLPNGQVGDVAVSGHGASSAVLAGAGRDAEAVRKLFLHEVLNIVEDEDDIQVHTTPTTTPVVGKYSTLATAPVPMSQSARAADRGKHGWDSDTVVSHGVYRNLSARALTTSAAAMAAAEAAARSTTVWFMTGDRGKLDEDGFLVVVGDAREMRAAEARKLALAATAEQRRKEEEDAASEVKRQAEEAKAEEAERRRAAGLEQEKDEDEAAHKADEAKLAAAAALAAAGGAAAARESWMRRHSNEAESSVNRSVSNNDGSAMGLYGSLGAAEDGRMKLDRPSAEAILAHLDRLAAGQATLEAELTAAHKARMDLVQQRLQAAEALAITRRQEMRRDADAAAAQNAAVAHSAAAAAENPAVMEVSVDEAQAAIMCAAAASEESAQATAAVATAAQAAAAAAAAAERASEATLAEVRKLPPPPSAAEKAMKLAVAAAASERAIAASKAAAERSAAAALLDVVDPNNVTKVVAISLDDVEAAVEGHPAVASARAFGRPDPKFGSEIYCAVVVKGGGRLSEPWLLLHAQSLLPAAAVPRRFYVVDEATIAADRSALAADTKLRPLSGVSGYAGAAVVRPPTWVPKSRRVQASV